MSADAGDRPGGSDHLLGQAGAIEINAEGAVEALMELDPSVRIAGRRACGGDIDNVLAKADGVVVSNHTAVFEAEELVEAALLRPGNPCHRRVLGGDGELLVVAGKVASEDLVGLLQG